jgi:hypothetical protein
MNKCYANTSVSRYTYRKLRDCVLHKNPTNAQFIDTSFINTVSFRHVSALKGPTTVSMTPRWPKHVSALKGPTTLSMTPRGLKHVRMTHC